jgi:hypothetical protein
MKIAHPEAHACQRRGRSARLPMELSATLFPTDRKNQAAFSKFLVRISTYYRQKLPTEFNATDNN